MEPRIDDLIHPSENESFYQTRVEFFSDASVFLTLLDNFGNQVAVHFGHYVDLFFDDSAFPAGFRQIDHGHIRIALKRFKMPTDQIPKFIHRRIGIVHRLSELLEHVFCFVAEKLNEDIVFVFEVQIDRAVCNTGGSGDLRDGCLMEALVGENVYRCVQDAMVFVTVPVFFRDDSPPAVTTTE